MAITLSVGFLIPVALEAQTAKDVFDSDVKLTWCGVDFSLAKFVGNAKEMSQERVEREVPSFNGILYTEKDKYDVRKYLNKYKVKYDLDITNKRNDELDFSKAVITKSSGADTLSLSDIKELVSGYDFGDASGVALIFIVEYFSKYKEEGLIWVTFASANSKSVIFSEKVIAKAGGFGFVNYWARTLFNTMETVEKNWHKWKRKYASKK
ncbi:MAG: hypothetical protein ABIV51_12710 [Saprospiraceae bacterium]